MASFSDLIKSKAIEPAFLKKQASVADVKRNIQAIGDLDKDNPNARTFNRVEVAANGSLEELKIAIKDLDLLLYDSYPEIETDEDYVADQKIIREYQFKLFNAIDSYIDLLKDKKIQYPPDMGNVPASNPSDLADVLAQLVKSQADSTAQLVKCQTDATTAATAQQIANASQHK